MAKDNRLSKTISNQDKYEFGLLSTAPSESSKQEINSLNNISTLGTSDGTFTFDQICEALRGKEDYIGEITRNMGGGLEYVDRNIGYCLKPNEAFPSNVAIWKSFWNEIGDDVDETIGKYPVICCGYSYASEPLDNYIQVIEKNHEYGDNLSTYKRYTSLECCDITPIFKNDKPLIIQPNEQKILSISFDAEFSLSFYPDPIDFDRWSEGFREFNIAWDEPGYSYYTEGSTLRLYDENKNIIKEIDISIGEGATTWDCALSYIWKNDTSSVQKICYFDIIADIFIAENSFSYEVTDYETGEVIRTVDGTTDITLLIYFDVNNFTALEITSDSKIKPFDKTNTCVYIVPHKCYEVHLNNEWCRDYQSSITDSGSYDGPYRSWSNKGIDSSSAKMFIDIHGYDTFKIYIRSHGEPNWDYIMVSQLDMDIEWDTAYQNSDLVKASTWGKSTSESTIDKYTLVPFYNIGGGDHRITIIYRKDASSHQNSDCGWVVIPTGQEKYSSVTVKGSRYYSFWGSDSPSYWPNPVSTTLYRTHDHIIKATDNYSLSAFKFNTGTGKYANSFGTSTYYEVSRFMGNYFSISDKLKDECNLSSFTSVWYGHTKYNSSYRCFHISSGYSGTTVSPSTPKVNCNGIFDVNICPTNMFTGVSGSGTYLAAFYPGKTKSNSSKNQSISTNTNIVGYDNEKIVVYIVPAALTITSESTYIKVYAAQGGQDSHRWTPVINSSSSITLTDPNGNSIQSVYLYPYYNNIVVVQNNTSTSTPSQTIDIYRYNRTTGEYITSTRYLQFGA